MNDEELQGWTWLLQKRADTLNRMVGAGEKIGALATQLDLVAEAYKEVSKRINYEFQERLIAGELPSAEDYQGALDWLTANSSGQSMGETS